MTLELPGYQVEGLLGRGGMGVVYRARSASGQRVALKVLDRLGAGARQRFEREATALRRIDHPNVCALVDFGELGHSWGTEAAGGLFIAMELLDGEDLQTRLDRTGTLSPLMAVRFAREAAAGLARAHSLGFVHRDIKPSNLFIKRVEASADAQLEALQSAEERLKVVDFGLAALLDGGLDGQGRLTRTGDVLGTPAWMAPEQARGEVTRQSAVDIFSLGAVLYHCLTGAPPFGCDAPLAVMVRLLNNAYTSLGERRPDLPTALIAVCDVMLAADPTHRPPTMAEIGARLAAIEALLQRSGTGETLAGPESEPRSLADWDGATDVPSALSMTPRRSAPGDRDGSTSTARGASIPLVGREPELAALAGLVRRSVEDGEASGGLLCGPAGIGKSRLVQAVVEDVSARYPELRVLSGAGVPARRFTGWFAIGRALRDALGVAHDASPDRVRERLHRLVAPLGQVPVQFLTTALGVAAVEEARQWDPRVVRDQVVNAIGDWLEHLCATGPVLLVLEDTQWMDGPSLELVDVLIRRLENAPLFVMLTARPHALRERPELERLASVARQELAELTGRASRRVLQAVWSSGPDSAHEPMEESLAQRLVDHAGGNPLFLIELAEQMRDAGRLPDGSWQRLPLPTTIEGAIQARLEHLEPTEADLLTRAAVFGERFWRDGLIRMGCPEPAGVLARLERKTLIRRPRPRDHELPHHGEYAFRQRVVREVAYQQLTGAQRAALHAAAGRWLSTVDDARPEVVAHHLDAGGEPGAAATFWARAARRAEQDGDIRAAFDRWRNAASSTDVPKSIRSALIGVLRAAHHLGEFEAAWPAFERLREQAEPGDGEALYWMGLIARFGPGAASAVYAESVALLEQAVAALAGLELEGLAVARLATLELRVGRAGALATAQKSVRLCGESGHGLALAWDSVAMALMYQGDLVRALAASRLALQHAGAENDLGLELSIQSDMAYVEARLGNLSDAARLLGDVVQGSKALGRQSVEGYGRHNLGWVLHNQGSYETGLAEQERALVSALRLGNLGLAGSSRTYLAIQCADYAEGPEALVQANAAIESTRGTGHEVLARVALAYATTAAGDTLCGRRAIERVDALREIGPMLELHEELAVARARLAVLEGDPAAARRIVAEEVARLEGDAERLGLNGAARARYLNGSRARRTLHEPWSG